jgi:magnesium transporter
MPPALRTNTEAGRLERHSRRDHNGVMAPSIRTRVWRNGILEAENFPLADVSDYLEQPDCLVWADLCDPDDTLLDRIADELSLDPHAVEDASSLHERPKATRYTTHLFLSTYALRHDTAACDMELTHVSAFLTRQAFVTVRLDDGFDIEQVVQRWDENADLVKFGSRSLEHALLDVIVDQYFDALEELDEEIEKLEGTVFDETSDRTPDIQRRSYSTRKALLRARRAILPMRDVVATVMRRSTEGDAAPELAPYFEDLYDHVLRATEWADQLREMITSIFETNMSLSDVRMNLIMKKLTAWAAIIAVPTAVTGWFGQNVPYPGFGHWTGFIASVVLISGLAVILYILFKRKDYL